MEHFNSSLCLREINNTQNFIPSFCHEKYPQGKQACRNEDNLDIVNKINHRRYGYTGGFVLAFEYTMMNQMKLRISQENGTKRDLERQAALRQLIYTFFPNSVIQTLQKSICVIGFSVFNSAPQCFTVPLEQEKSSWPPPIHQIKFPKWHLCLADYMLFFFDCTRVSLRNLTPSSG